MGATVEFKNVDKCYGEYHALENINLEIDEGEIVSIIGPSGSRKSTLIRTMNRLEKINSGQLIATGYDLADKKTDISKIRKNVDMVFQHFNLRESHTVLENIMLVPRIVLKQPEAENKEIVMKLLKRVGLEEKADLLPKQLSGGQEQRVAIARLLAMKPKAILFDEPTNTPDPEMVQDVLDVMKYIIQIRITMVVVTHGMGFARKVGSRLLFFDKGKVLEDSHNPKEFFTHPKTERTRELLSKVINH